MELSRFFMIVIFGGFAMLVAKGDEKVSCGLDETQCQYGCCPYADAVCCSDGFECCQQGQTCIPYLGLCIGVQSNSDGNVTLYSNKTTAVRSYDPCLPGTTTCPGGCCPFPEGECCSDNTHCCPNGWSCTASGCASNGSVNPFLVGRIERPAQEEYAIVPLSPSLSLKTCPDGKRQCPEGSNCCTGDNGEWNCCPASPVSVKEVCCDTYAGYFCCPVYFGVQLQCHYWGCWWT